jgi:hypothetical protein
MIHQKFRTKIKWNVGPVSVSLIPSEPSNSGNLHLIHYACFYAVVGVHTNFFRIYLSDAAPGIVDLDASYWSFFFLLQFPPYHVLIVVLDDIECLGFEIPISK